MPRVSLAECLALTALLGACAKEVPIVEVSGECGDAYGAQVCTWARMQGDSLVELGATVPVAGIENAPKDAPMTWPPVPAAVLALPAAAQQQAGMTHLTIYWENMGHPPGAYLTPHFDFHFYTISPADRTAMDCADLSKPGALPAGYNLPDVVMPPPIATMIGTSTLVGLCVPQMGMHSLLEKELSDTTLFGGTMVIGYYKGQPIFIEPMLSQAMLLEKRPFTLPVPAIPGMTGSYPRAFRAEWIPEQNAYRFVFSNAASGS